MVFIYELELNTCRKSLKLAENLQNFASQHVGDSDNGGETFNTQSFIQVHNFPTFMTDDFTFALEYYCAVELQIKVKLVALLDEGNKTLYHKKWTCNPEVAVKVPLNVRLKEKISNILYAPDFFNREYVYAKAATLHVALTQKNTIEQYMSEKSQVIESEKTKQKYSNSQRKNTQIQHNVIAEKYWTLEIADPFSRPKRPPRECLSWGLEILLNFTHLDFLSCPVEPEYVEIVQFPFAVGGTFYGIWEKLQPFKAPALLEIPAPWFTVSLWIYAVDFCPLGSKGSVCSLLHTSSANHEFQTPLVAVNKQGRVHIWVYDEQGIKMEAWTYRLIPKQQWCHLVVNFDNKQWTFSASCDDGKIKFDATYILPRPYYYDDTKGFLLLGGTSKIAAFKGYIGQASIYRRRKVQITEIPPVPVYHVIYELGLSQRAKRCASYTIWLDHKITLARTALQSIIQKKSCRNTFLASFKDESQNMAHCSATPGSRPGQFRWMTRHLRRAVFDGRSDPIAALGGAIYKNVTMTIEDHGLRSIISVIPLLKQASCYGNHDASLMLAVIYSHGLQVRADNTLGHSYILDGALTNHRLSMMALGNKHRYGLDGVQYNEEQAYAYYKNVADRTIEDRKAYNEEDVHTEWVRVTDEWQVEAQTDETGELYQWLEHQAGAGNLNAQLDLAKMLHWGSQGVARNPQKAAFYFKRGADAGDAESMYNYGFILMVGKGIEKDITLGLHYMEMAAELNFPNAFNMLGWYAHNEERNITKAAYWYSKGAEMGNPEANTNMGYFYQGGLIPGKPADQNLAAEYFLTAANMGQLDAGIQVAHYYMRAGTSVLPRNPPLATLWARHIAEQNPAIGKVLRSALMAYKEGNWEVALLFYMMAADVGLEVANFNLAHLCEEHQGEIAQFISGDCIWRHYNLSSQRPLAFVNSLALLKMGDYQWYGHGGAKNISAAVNMYTLATEKKNAEGLYNIARMVEGGEVIPQHILRRLNIPVHMQYDNVTLLMELFTRCSEMNEQESWLPCILSYYNVYIQDVWQRYHTHIKVLIGVFGGLLILYINFMIYCYLTRNEVPLDVNV
ncbi:unnamed protein product [Owenia fusiformis]|uniref:Uncharacterized protein n=1 Tax=Owenia fusiformis TaxID=6347 RepID=A0A8S4PM49_OWEFU|nr:unnamed protein product [Owenia fusiformis]